MTNTKITVVGINTATVEYHVGRGGFCGYVCWSTHVKGQTWFNSS